ncbi:SGNH/GDSL hydrolase family protein [Ruficoccus amylovorans]|uniref:SGNH/GDSL hydrolase family protein n=1 Tax=Ruficoccus amylovorans TaxID=1804625 RepID=A0A842HFK1_9BACT|nr:SGNH/GDSL hydrolase family protein [Ruficoccus amylovorans]MBC2595192.1 SGNH/GDSL hydrolase family protein [Ruficoccus amylovorans]
MSLLFNPGQTILFQGDSITDALRDKETNLADMGRGYASMAAAWLGASRPELGLSFINRGMSGNRITDLVERWQKDCLELKPDWVSVLIGLNDTWRRYDSADPTSVEDFYERYRSILTQCVEAGCRLILCEPFLLPYPEDRKVWREDLDPKIQAVRELAREFGTPYVPFDGVFAAASMKQPPSYWTVDGIHPTPAGHALMARHWLATVGLEA